MAPGPGGPKAKLSGVRWARRLIPPREKGMDMVLVLAAEALLALLVFGTIRYVDTIVDYVIGPASGMELEVPDEDG